MKDWSAWIGRREARQEVIVAATVEPWLATFDRSDPEDGSTPQGFHWSIFRPGAPTAMLGTDGHPIRDDGASSFLPPIPLPRRMWAGSKTEFGWPLRSGDTVTRTSHTGAPPAPPPPGDGRFDPGGWDAHRMLVPSEALLFRYSALTFNSHRIHYDLPYATEEEGYRGLVVHGPLTATLLLDLAARHFGDNALTRFDFRGTSPAICGEELHLALRGDDDAIVLGAFASDGRQVMAASAAR